MTSTTRTMNEADFNRVLSERLRENGLWRDLFKAVSQVMTNYVHERATQLSRIRAAQHVHRGDYLNTPLGRGKVAYIKHGVVNGEIEDEIEVEVPGVGSVTIPLRSSQRRSVLINGSRHMGFDFFSDNISDEDYARIYRYIGHYWQHSGTKTFVDFMGFIKNMLLEIDQLWTRDKGDFANSDDPEISKYDFLESFDPNSMLPIWQGLQTPEGIDTESEPIGKDYPTSHVALSYDIIVTPNANISELVSLFYFLAPIHLVLERINATINVEVPVYRGYASQLHYYESAHLELDESFNGMIDFTNSTTRDESLALVLANIEGKIY